MRELNSHEVLSINGGTGFSDFMKSAFSEQGEIIPVAIGGATAVFLGHWAVAPINVNGMVAGLTASILLAVALVGISQVFDNKPSELKTN